jgi:hypothetical protein
MIGFQQFVHGDRWRPVSEDGRTGFTMDKSDHPE